MDKSIIWKLRPRNIEFAIKIFQVKTCSISNTHARDSHIEDDSFSELPASNRTEQKPYVSTDFSAIRPVPGDVRAPRNEADRCRPDRNLPKSSRR